MNYSISQNVIFLILSFIYRRTALAKWKDCQMHHATYGNLLQVFVDAGHTECAEALCAVLRKECECPNKLPLLLLVDTDETTPSNSSSHTSTMPCKCNVTVKSRNVECGEGV